MKYFSILALLCFVKLSFCMQNPVEGRPLPGGSPVGHLSEEFPFVRFFEIQHINDEEYARRFLDLHLVCCCSKRKNVPVEVLSQVCCPCFWEMVRRDSGSLEQVCTCSRKERWGFGLSAFGVGLCGGCFMVVG